MKWLELSDDRKQLVLDQASAKLSAPKNALEKDWWVTVALRAIFNTPFAKDIVFKGGTSLSKSWQLISRLSEDIDLAINREALGFGVELTYSQIKKLKRKGVEFTSTEFRQAVEQELYRLGIQKGTINIYAKEVPQQRPDTDPQAIFIEYPTVLGANPYLLPPVKIEMSVRSLVEPSHERMVGALMDEAIPGQDYAGDSFAVHAIDPKITILEKVFLLHEEFTKPPDRIRTERMSRHLHDLEKTMDTEHGKLAISDQGLYDQLIAHRRYYIRDANVQYDRHNRETLSFLPTTSWVASYREDYELMKENMFRGEAMDFEKMMERLSAFERRIKRQ